MLSMNPAHLITALDDALLRALNAHMGQHPAWDHLMERLLDFDQLKFGLPIYLMVAMWASNRPGQGERRRTLINALMGGLAGLIVARSLALLLPFRMRPFARPELTWVLPDGFEPQMRTWSAFPSDHAVLALALVTGIWLISRRWGWIALLHAVLVICLPRLYMGLHHPSDLIAGGLLGVACTLVLQRATRRPAHLMLQQAQHRPAFFYSVSALVLYQMISMFLSLRQGAVPLFRYLNTLAA